MISLIDLSEIVIKKKRNYIHYSGIKVQGASVNDNENNCLGKRNLICSIKLNDFELYKNDLVPIIPYRLTLRAGIGDVFQPGK